MGNPYLKTRHIFANSLLYSFNSKYFDLTSVLFYNILNRDITQFYTFNEALQQYSLQYLNSDYTRQTGVQLSGSIKPFGSNILVAKIFLQPAFIYLKTMDGKVIKNNYLQNRISLSSSYKNLSIQYSLSIPDYILNGAFLNTTENANHLFASYKLKDWSLSAGIYWMGMPSEYKTKSLPESLVNYSAHTQIFNNKNMFVLGLSYDFSSGKKLQIQKKLENSTAPAATF